jgi:hypothetical protein
LKPHARFHDRLHKLLWLAAFLILHEMRIGRAFEELRGAVVLRLFPGSGLVAGRGVRLFHLRAYGSCFTRPPLMQCPVRIRRAPAQPAQPVQPVRRARHRKGFGMGVCMREGHSSRSVANGRPIRAVSYSLKQ